MEPQDIVHFTVKNKEIRVGDKTPGSEFLGHGPGFLRVRNGKRLRVLDEDGNRAGIDADISGDITDDSKLPLEGSQFRDRLIYADNRGDLKGVKIEPEPNAGERMVVVKDGLNNINNANLVGTAKYAHYLANNPKINGHPFDGVVDVSLSAGDVGALPVHGTADEALKLKTARKIAGKAFDGTSDISISSEDVGALSLNGGTVSGGTTFSSTLNVGTDQTKTNLSVKGSVELSGKSGAPPSLKMTGGNIAGKGPTVVLTGGGTKDSYTEIIQSPWAIAGTGIASVGATAIRAVDLHDYKSKLQLRIQPNSIVGHETMLEIGSDKTVTIGPDTSLDNPTSFNATFSFTAGSVFSEGESYWYAVTFYNAHGESSKRDSARVYVPAGGAGSIIIDGIPTSTTIGVTGRNIYRTETGMANPFFLVGTISDNNATRFIDTTPNSVAITKKNAPYANYAQSNTVFDTSGIKIRRPVTFEHNESNRYLRFSKPNQSRDSGYDFGLISVRPVDYGSTPLNQESNELVISMHNDRIANNRDSVCLRSGMIRFQTFGRSVETETDLRDDNTRLMIEDDLIKATVPISATTIDAGSYSGVSVNCVKVTGLALPEGDTDAASKAYVDSRASAVSKPLTINGTVYDGTVEKSFQLLPHTGGVISGDLAATKTLYVGSASLDEYPLQVYGNAQFKNESGTIGSRVDIEGGKRGSRGSTLGIWGAGSKDSYSTFSMSSWPRGSLSEAIEMKAEDYGDGSDRFTIYIRQPSGISKYAIGINPTGSTNPVAYPTIEIGGDLIPFTHDKFYLGQQTERWISAWLVKSVNTTSDRTTKKNIRKQKLGLKFIQDLVPVSYQFKGETGPTVREGFIAQQVKATLDRHQVDSEMWTDGKTQGLAYDQFISPLVKAVQELSQQVKDLKTEVNMLRARAKSKF